MNLNGASDSGGINISEASEEGRIDPDFIGDASIDARFDSQGVQWEWFPHQDDSYTVSFNHVLSETKQKYGVGQFEISKDDEFNLRFLAQTTRFEQHKLSLGLDIQSHDFSYSFDAIPYFCTDHSADCDEQKGQRIQGNDNIKANIYGLYANDIWNFTPNFSMELGVRADHRTLANQS